MGTLSEMKIELPSSQEEIPAAIEQLAARSEELRLEMNAIRSLVDIVRDMCAHPEAAKVKVSHMGHLYHHCSICGREWDA